MTLSSHGCYQQSIELRIGPKRKTDEGLPSYQNASRLAKAHVKILDSMSESLTDLGYVRRK